MATDNKDAENVPEKEDLLLDGQLKPYGQEGKKSGCCSKKRLVIVGIVLAMLLLYGLGLGIGLAIGLSKGADDAKNDTDGASEVTQTRVGAVVTDHEACSKVGRVILDKGGTAVDAAIAALVCNGLRTPHSMGIGGGCYMLIYDKFTNSAITINGRETAPRQLTHENYLKMIADSPLNPAVRVAVPGEIKAYKMAHNMYGRLSWEELFAPTITMAEEGFPLPQSTAKALAIFVAYIGRANLNLTHFPQLCELVCANTTTGEPMKAGTIIHMPKLAVTLRGIAKEGPDYLYSSGVTQEIVAELKEAGSLLSRFDFELDYSARKGNALEFKLGDLKLYSMGEESGGSILGLINTVIEGLKLTPDDISTEEKRAEAYHKIIETFKLAYPIKTRLGDPDFSDTIEVMKQLQSSEFADYLRSKIDPDRTHEMSFYTNVSGEYRATPGTSHVSVLSSYGDAVSVTSSVNYYFGKGLVSNSTGIIWNNHMDDFCQEPMADCLFKENSVEPGKRPLSSMSPVIVVDKEGNVRLVTGAAGGTRITTVTAQLIPRLLWLKQSLEEAVDEKRFHHQLFPDNVLHLEAPYPSNLVKRFEDKGHVIKNRTTYMAVLETIFVDDAGKIHAYADKRKKPGKASYAYVDSFS